ncbi:hypothetical protein K32_01900 [Kaistia sp. 32K]|nr:hypothetical protein K32_01900 [Kaistia sp. 32K]
MKVFNQLTLDGYFAGRDGDLGWAHRGDADREWNAFVAGNAGSGGHLVFGRITYELMAGYWSTPMAESADPVVARAMNGLPKTVFSRTLKAASWQNTRLASGELATEIRDLKANADRDLVILGSGSLVAQLAATGLIDSYQLVVNPVVLGDGWALFEGATRRLDLRLADIRRFDNGNVLLSYELPA